MREVTFKQKGLAYVSQLALENIQALKAIIQWNHEHGIRFFRYTLPPKHHLWRLKSLQHALKRFVILCCAMCSQPSDVCQHPADEQTHVSH